MTREDFHRFAERAANLLRDLYRNLYVERQFFLRSSRGVRYVRLSARSQAWMSAAALLLALWIGISSLSLFGAQERFERKNQTLRAQLRATVVDYETRLAASESAARSRIEALSDEYQDLHARFEDLRQEFFGAVDALETRQQRLRMSLDEYRTLEAPFDEDTARLQAQLMQSPPENSNRLLAVASKLPRPLMQSRITPLSLQLPGQDGQMPTSPHQRSGLQSDLQRHYPHIASMLRAASDSTEEWVQEMNGAADAALRRLDVEYSHLTSAVEEWMEEDIARMERILSIAGLPEQFTPKTAPAQTSLMAQTASGGPLLAGTSGIAGENAAGGAGGGAGANVAGGGHAPRAERQLARIAANLKRLNALQETIESLPLALPLKQETFSLSSGYGMRNDPFSGRRAFHGGLDFSAPYKSPALATAPGVVTRVGWSGAYGRIVDIDHGNGVSTRYGHLAQFLVEKGDEVTAQQPIGLVGSSGRSTGAHLHYEIRLGGRALNPWHFLKAGHYVVSQNVAAQR